VLTIVGFPTATTPGILDDLNRLAFPYRWSTRAIMLDKADATKLLTRIRRQWFAKRKSVAAILKEVMTNETSSLIDTDASNKAIDADAALQELGSDLIGEAFVTATITVWDENPRLADERLRLVEKVIQGRDFTCMVETVNAVDAWLGSLPGHVYANVRQPPVSTLNIAHMIPLSAFGAGPARGHSSRRAAAVLRPDGRINAVPLLAPCRGRRTYAGSRSDRCGQIRAAGVDGAAIPSLSHVQVFAFDFGGSIRVAALAMKGDWHDLGGALSNDAL
jgi:type IV secretion system protein VirB4